jgi:hypothetical protein
VPIEPRFGDDHPDAFTHCAQGSSC